MQNNSKQFYEVLFDKGEYTCFAENTFGTKVFDVFKTGLKEENEFFSINPHKPRTTRAGKNVTFLRNFLFEIDKDKDKKVIDFEDQREIILRSGLPWTTRVNSAGKSIHTIVSLVEPVADIASYRIWWLTIASVLNKIAGDMGYNLEFDPQTKDPSRLSRAANAVRFDAKKIQRVEEVRTRVTQRQMFDWFIANGTCLDDHTPKVYEHQINQVNPDISDDERVKYVLENRMKNMQYAVGQNANTWQFTFARLLRSTGMDEMSVRAAIIQHCGQEDHRKPVESAFSSKYDSDEKIYVWSKAERAAWAKNQEFEETVEKMNLDISEPVSEEALHQGVADYIRVGTKYYKIEDDSIILWSPDTLKTDFGREVLSMFPEEQKYSKFCNVINYFEYQQRFGKKYNLFRKPEWDLKPGKFPTTLLMFKRVFDDQIKYGIDWVQLLIMKPEQILHCLVLLSRHRETGKNTFMEWIQKLLGRCNVYIGEVDDLLGPFNSAFASKHVICIDEVRIDRSNSQAANKLKKWVTQKTVNINEKNAPVHTVDYFGKIIMATNDVDDFMKIDDEENRFWLRELPFLDKSSSDFDPDFEKKLEEEIPFFLHWLINRELHCQKKESRFWLPEDITNTRATKNLKENSRSDMYYEIQMIIDNMFEKLPTDDTLHFTLTDIRVNLPNSMRDTKIKNIKQCLENEFKLKSHKMLRYNSFTMEEKNVAYYFINRKDWEGPQTQSGQVAQFGV